MACASPASVSGVGCLLQDLCRSVSIVSLMPLLAMCSARKPSCVSSYMTTKEGSLLLQVVSSRIDGMMLLQNCQ